MARYAWFVEFGRRPGTMPPDVPELKRWARLAWGGNLYQLRKHIAKYGTRPHPFIRPGLQLAREKILAIIEKHKKKLR